MTIRRTGSMAAVCILATMLLAGCSGPSLADRLAEQIESSGGTAVELANVVDAGDSFLVVCLYDSDITERLGLDWADAPDTFRSDNSQTVVVVGDGAVESSHAVAFSDMQLCSAEVRELTALTQPLNFSQNAVGTWVLVD